MVRAVILSQVVSPPQRLKKKRHSLIEECQRRREFPALEIYHQALSENVPFGMYGYLFHFASYPTFVHNDSTAVRFTLVSRGDIGKPGVVVISCCCCCWGQLGSSVSFILPSWSTRVLTEQTVLARAAAAAGAVKVAPTTTHHFVQLARVLTTPAPATVVTSGSANSPEERRIRKHQLPDFLPRSPELFTKETQSRSQISLRGAPEELGACLCVQTR